MLLVLLSDYALLRTLFMLCFGVFDSFQMLYLLRNTNLIMCNYYHYMEPRKWLVQALLVMITSSAQWRLHSAFLRHGNMDAVRD